MLNISSQKKNAFERLLFVSSNNLGKIATYTIAILGIASLYPTINLPPYLALIAGGLGVEALGSILENVANNENMSNEEIASLIEQTLQSLNINQALTKKDMSEFIDFLMRKLSTQDRTGKEIFSTLTRLEMKLDEKIADLPSHVLLDRLDQLHINIANLHKGIDDLKPSVSKLNNLHSANADKNKPLGETAVKHLIKSTQISNEMTKATQEFSQGINNGIQQISKLIEAKSITSASLKNLVDNLRKLVANYATVLENSVPAFAQEHKLALECYVQDTAYWFSSGSSTSDAVESMLKTLTQVYKPQLSKSVKVSIFISDNQAPLLNSLKPYVKKGPLSKYKKAERRLFKARNLQKELRLKAFEQIIEAEKILKSMQSYIIYINKD